MYALNPLWALLLLCLLIHSLSSISFIEKTAKGQTEGENAKVFLFLFLELEDAIISKVDNHNDSVRRHSHTGRAIHLSKATPLCAEFA